MHFQHHRGTKLVAPSSRVIRARRKARGFAMLWRFWDSPRILRDHRDGRGSIAISDQASTNDPRLAISDASPNRTYAEYVLSIIVIFRDQVRFLRSPSLLAPSAINH